MCVGKCIFWMCVSSPCNDYHFVIWQQNICTFTYIFKKKIISKSFFFASLNPVNSFVLCSGPSAVPWWRSCRCPWSANAGSNTSPSHPLWWKRRRSSTCTLSTTADCQGKRPWPEMGISTMLSPSLLQRGGLQRHGGKWRGEMVNGVVTGFQSLITELLWIKAEVCGQSDEISCLFFLWIACA